MSKYVTRKHGLVLGSDNVFLLNDKSTSLDEPPIELPEGVSNMRSGYNAIVRFYSYKFDNFTWDTLEIMTPAQQLVWAHNNFEWEIPIKSDDGMGSYHLPYSKSYYTIKPMWLLWLNNAVGKIHDRWDVYTRSNNHIVFFKKRADALAFCREIEELLSGIAITKR